MTPPLRSLHHSGFGLLTLSAPPRTPPRSAGRAQTLSLFRRGPARPECSPHLMVAEPADRAPSCPATASLRPGAPAPRAGVSDPRQGQRKLRSAERHLRPAKSRARERKNFRHASSCLAPLQAAWRRLVTPSHAWRRHLNPYIYWGCRNSAPSYNCFSVRLSTRRTPMPEPVERAFADAGISGGACLGGGSNGTHSPNRQEGPCGRPGARGAVRQRP